MKDEKSVENTRRELFEAWAINHTRELGYSFPEEVAQVNGLGDYAIVWVQGAWLGFNAALDSVVIEVPPYHELHEMTSGDLYDAVLVSIESTNLGIKVK